MTHSTNTCESIDSEESPCLYTEEGNNWKFIGIYEQQEFSYDSTIVDLVFTQSLQLIWADFTNFKRYHHIPSGTNFILEPITTNILFEPWKIRLVILGDQTIF